MRSIAGYDVLSEIGRGSMGVVRLARQRDLDRLVALKELQDVHAGSPELAKRFVREARLAGSLSHPNIVTVHDIFEVEETPYIAMEYLPRGSLRPWVGTLTQAQLSGVLEGLLAGLGAAEAAGIVHRDLKPENILIAGDGHVKIADFGIAKATESTGTGGFLTATGAAVGTPAYMAPEQALSQEVGPWTDLYAIGVIAYEQLVGRVPFADSKSSTEILVRHVNEEIPPVVESRPEVGRALSDWVARLLVKDPASRTASAAQAWDELEEIVLETLGPRWRRDAALPPRPRNAASAHVPDEPEAESRMFSYQRTPGSTVGAAASADERGAETSADAGPDPEAGPEPEANPDPGPARSEERGARRRGRARAAARWALGAGRGRIATVRASLAVALLGAAAVPIGFALARAGGGGSSPARAATGSYTVAVPPGWRRGTSLPSTPGLDPRTPLVLATQRPSGELVLGFGTAVDGTLLPAGVLARLPSEPRPEAVRLGGDELYRYRALAPRGWTGTATLYAQPTSAGILLGACLLPRSGSASVELGCERIVGSRALAAGRALALGPSAAYAARLTAALSRLNAVRAAAGEALAKAGTATGQAAAAERLAAAHRSAAASVRASEPGPADRTANASLSAALERLASGYSALARAARAEDRAGFDAGRATVQAGEVGLAAAIARLQRLGYAIGG